MNEYKPVQRKPCTRSDFWHESVGARCSTCQHSNVVHSVGDLSETADGACQLCVLEIKIDQLNELIDTYQKVLDGALASPKKPT